MNTATDFATRLHDRLASTQPGKDLFLSPFSIKVALAMCAAGARGETRRVLADLIGAPASVDEQNRHYADLLKSINGEAARAFELVTANALWGQQGCTFRPEYRQAVAEFYDGAFNEVDFAAAPDEAVRTINAWVSAKTRDKIQDLLARSVITADTRLILTNAIYFKAAWADPFRRQATRDEDWYGPTGTRQVPMMHQSGSYLYGESDDFQVLDLPYQEGQQSLLVVLPRKKDGLAALERKWAAADGYQKATKGLRHETRVMVSLPRFKLEAAFQLAPVLGDLGAGRAFSDDADFSGISAEPLKIGAVVHKAFVEVNEEGTEAAAATAVAMLFAGIQVMPEPKVFQADHPFLFFIRDRASNTVLFSGRLLDPH